ncbi:MAG: SusC/RagA family TonB-linked outer membrane protein [Bacteroidales bacterium]|nr:SusC/RagA family TonB-linked outer membrane protein [Bacteroidales bacterium]
MKKQLLLLLFSLFAVVAFGRTVTGTVTQASDGEPLIGVTVAVKGTSTVTATDIDGKYSIEVSGDNAVLNFNYVGMTAQSIPVGNKSVVDVVMSENATVLNEVVVTAMGQVQEKKKLNFAVQALNSDEVTAGQSSNFVNTLQGKVAGVQVSMAGGSPNSASQIVVRAISSINNAQSNEPLFVIDGMPVRGAASSIADINPNDIQTMSVLKGAAASALYGQEGANGVILITTKSGKEGTVTVTASGGWEWSTVTKTPKLQKSFLAGSNGFYTTNATGGWGPRFRNGVDTYYDNTDNFLGTGFMQKYDLAISGGNEKFSSYASANYMDNEGVVPKDYKKRLGVFIKGEYNPSNTVKILMSTNFIDTKSRGFGNAMSTIYGWAINRNMADYQTVTGMPNWANRYDAWDELTNDQRLAATLSPYYSRYNDSSDTQSTRVIINGQIQWEPIKNLTFTGKLSYDKSHSTYESYTTPRYDETRDFDGELSEGQKTTLMQRQGTYCFSPSRGERFTAQALANYYWQINDKFNLNFFVGAEYSQTKGLEANMGGYDFQLGGDFYSFNNVNPESLTLGTSDYALRLNHTEKNKYGYFGEIRFDYKGMAQVSVTGRIDGSSTLKQCDSSYFYPSFTGGLIFSEIFGLHNEWFSYGKLRGNYAKVGKDAPANQFSDNYKQWPTFPDGGFGVNPTLSSANWLEPEMTKSWEIGADLRFFNSRTRLDIAYYNTTVDNQIVTVRVSPAAGQILQTRNEGSIENKGMEVTLSQDILQMRDFQWTANVNFSFNRGKVKSLPEEVSEIQGGQYSDVFCSAYLGESTTGLSGTDYLRNDNGDVICDSNGYPMISPNKQNYIGNREPDFLLGLGSTFTWKDLSLSFLFDGRKGGDVYNYTGRSLFSSGQSWYLAKYRNRKAVFKGVVANADGTYSPNTTPVILDQQFINNYFYNVASNFIEDGSYIRLSYVTLSYDFTKFMKKLGSRNPIKGLKASFTGRNLWLWTKYTGVDPQVMPSAANGTGAMGIDNFSVPSLRSYNINLNVTF